MKSETIKLIQDIQRQVLLCLIGIRWRSSNNMAGGRNSHMRGSGDDFDTMDIYEPGDDCRAINWMAYAQSGGQTAYTNIYKEQRSIGVQVIVDTTKSMEMGTNRTTKNILSAELAASICCCAEKAGDTISLMTYSGCNVNRCLPARSAKLTLLPMLVSILEPSSKEGGKGSGLIKALSNLPSRRTLVFVLSDFANLTQHEKEALRKAASIHDLVCLVIQDLREHELQNFTGFYTFVDMETGEEKTILVNESTCNEFVEFYKKQQAELVDFFKQFAITHEVVSTEQSRSNIIRLMQLFFSMRHKLITKTR